MVKVILWLITFLMGSVSTVSMYGIYQSVTATKRVVYVFKPEPDVIVETSTDTCYGWKYLDFYNNEKIHQICEEK